MTSATITITELPNGRIGLKAPFHSGLAGRAKAAGGRWDPEGKFWHFDARDQERVEAIAGELFGWTKASSGAVVTVRIDAGVHEQRDVIRFAGRQVARRRGRDEPVRLAEGVVIVDGAFPRAGGSVANPRVNGAGVILEIRDLPAESLDVEDERYYHLVGGADARIAQLEAERAELAARLSEIDTELVRLKAGA